MENEIATPPVETITFDPPIQVNQNYICNPPNMVVTTADIVPQDDPNYVVAIICGDGRCIGVPFVDSNENSIRVALS